MSVGLMRRVLRERRRFAVLVLLIYAALKLAGPDAGALPLAPAFTAILAAGALALAAAVVPRLRSYAETMALAGLGVAGLVRALPGSPADLDWSAGIGPAAAAGWIGLAVLARGLRHAARTSRSPNLRGLRFQARSGTRVDVLRLWYGLVPTPGMAAHYGDPEVSAIEDAGARLGRIHIVTEGPNRRREAFLQVLEHEAPFHVRLRTSELDRHGELVATGVSEIYIVELGPKRLVLFAHEFPDMPLGRALLAWLDDSAGRLLDRRLATIERRAQAAESCPDGMLADHPLPPLGGPAAGKDAAGLTARAARPRLGTPAGPG